MDLFVYDWAYNGYALRGHCLDEYGKYTCLTVTDFFPSCYVEGDTVPRSSVVPRTVEFKRMLSSKDVSTLRPFNRLFFDNAADMATFSREQGYRCDMADIPQVSTFLSQVDADHVGWIRVSSAKSRFGIVSARMKDIESIPDKIPPSTPRVMSFDIEVKSQDAGMPQPHRTADTVEMISAVVFGGGGPVETYVLHAYPVEALDVDGTEVIAFEDEIGLITGFFELVKRTDPTILTGFNIYGFDMHYLVSRLKLRLVEMPSAQRGTHSKIDVIKVDWSSDAYGHNSYDRLVIGGRLIVDMYLYFKRMKLDKYSLNFVSEKFIGQKKNDMPYVEMAAAFVSRDVEALSRVARYCVQDSALVMELFDKVKMWIDVCEISKITRCGIEDIYTRGEQMKMVSQCVAECGKRNIVLQPQRQSDWQPYEGAYVLDPVKGVYDGCSILDFQSLYPSIIIAYNICPSTYGGDVRIETTEHSFKREPVGMLPGMIKRILDERKSVKEQMTKLDRDSVERIVLDRRQNALKICANSVYGMMGFKNSRYFGHLGCAESVTTVGRLLLSKIVDEIQMKYPVKVVYGDSVAGYTPTIVRIGKERVCTEAFENLATRWGKNAWTQCDSGKEACELCDVEVWSNDGWTRMHRVIRHVLAPHKKMIRVITHGGIVDVTDEHSLLDADGEPKDAKEVRAGDRLLHHPYPMPGSSEVTDTVKDTHYIEYAGYVYDATTDNNHFQAGIGSIIVHNTDSCMLWHDDDLSRDERISLAQSVCDDVTVSLPEPMALKFETYCDKVILLTKKRYVLVTGDRVSYKGVMNARRDYCKYAKDTYSKAMEMVAMSASCDDISNYIDIRILRLLSGRVDVSELVVTKSLARKLNTYRVNQPHVVLAKRLVLKTGLDVPAGTRLEYVYVTDPDVPMVTPQEFETGEYATDGMFYVRKQLATQVDDVLSAIGMGNYIKESWL